MSEPTKNAKKNPENTSVDWAEKLKVSMSEGYREETADTSFHEEDDLAAMLRAQLGKSAEQTSIFASLDTSEFEEPIEEDPDEADEEEFEEPIEEDPDEADEEEFEEPIEEEPDEADEEEFEEPIEEDPDEADEEEFEEPIEEDPDEADEEEFEEPIEEEPDEADEEEFEEPIEEDPDEADEEEFEEPIEEDPDEADEEEFEEPIEEDPDEADEEEFEEPIEEELDEADEEEFEEPIEEDPDEADEEEFDEPIEEELDEADEEEFEEPIDDEFDEIVEDTESLFDQTWADYEVGSFDSVSDDVIEYREEEDFDDFEVETYDELAFSVEERQEPANPKPVFTTGTTVSAYRKPTGKGLTDAGLNGLASNEAVGGRRLRELDEENTRLLEEVTHFMSGRKDSREGDPHSAGAEAGNCSKTDSEGTQADAYGKNGKSRLIQTHDPLQLDLDDVSPTAKKNGSLQLNHKECGSNGSVPEKNAHTYASEMIADGTDSDGIRDMDLCVRLGYEDSLRHADNLSVVEEIRAQKYEGRILKNTDDRPMTAHGQEYRGRVDTDQVESSYVRAYRKNLIRLCLAGVGVLASTIYDILPLILAQSQGDVVPFATTRTYPLIAIIWLVLISLPFLRRFARGIQSLWNFEPNAYAVSAVSFMVAVAGGVLACAVSPEKQLPLFCAPALWMLAIAAASEFFVTEGEHKAFSVVSSGKSAHVLTNERTSASAVWQDSESNAEHGDRDLFAGKRRPVMTVVRTKRVADYFARTEQYNPYMGRMNYMFPVALLIAIVNAGIVVARGGDFVSAGIPVFIATYLCVIPASYLLAMSLPLYRANQILNQKGAAVIGSAAPSEYTVKPYPSLIFSDGDALKSMYRKEITLRDDPESEEYRRKADIVFRLLDTPLGVESALRNQEYDGYRIEIAETAEQYVRLYLTDTSSDSATEIMLGSHDALARRGIRLPKINMESRYKKSENSHVIYLAFNRCFHLAYAAEYRVGRTFAKVSSVLTELGHGVALLSYDPMVAQDMEGITMLRKRNGVKLIRPTAYEPIYTTRSSGLIATGRSLDILRPLIACHNMRRAYRNGHMITWLLMAIGAILSVVTVVVGESSLLTSATVVAWQILSSVAVFAGTVHSVGHKALSQANDKQGRSNTDAQSSVSENENAQNIRK